MSSVSFNRKRVKLKALLGIRARLALLALILVAPLMLERARSLEDTRAKQIAAASQEFSTLAQHSANGQREVISSVEALLKSAAYIRASAGGVGKSCLILRGSLQVDLPWIANLSIVGRDGRVQCSTLNGLVVVGMGAIATHAAHTGVGSFLPTLVAISLVGPIGTGMIARFIEGRRS